jgi:hypothetical protein
MSSPGTQHTSNPVVAKAYWDHIGDMLKFTTQIQADYGKWLIVTVTSVHLAALYLVTQPGVLESVRTNPWSYWPFIIGICSILIAGLITWANWSISACIYGGWRHPFMLVDPAYWPKNAGSVKKFAMPVTFWGALVIGIFSALCLPWGAYNVLGQVKPPAPPIIVKTPQKPIRPDVKLVPAEPMVDLGIKSKKSN